MSWRDEFQLHQEFAESLCWLLSMHAFRGRRRNNPLVPPSLQKRFFNALVGRNGFGPQALWTSCFPDMDEASFKAHLGGRAPMDMTLWRSHVLRLRRLGFLSWEQADSLRAGWRSLDWAHTALVACRSAFNKKIWDRMVSQKEYMLFSWPLPGQSPVRQTLEQRQGRPWRDDDDCLDRRPPGGRSLPSLRMTAVKWWDDRCPLVWQIGLTPYPLKFDKRISKVGSGWAVRLLMDPYEAAWEVMKGEPRYQSVPPSWGSCEYQQTLELLRSRHELFANP